MARILFCFLPFLIAAKPATKPAEPERIHPLVLSAVASAGQGDLKSIADEADKAANELLAKPGEIDPGDVTSVATVREFGKFFGRLPAISEPNKKLLAWLIQQPKLSQALMMAVSPEDPPDGVLDVLRALYDDQGDKLASYPDLVAAFCVVWDATGEVDENTTATVDLPRVVRLYRYYTSAGKSLRFDVKDLPWQLSTWVVANPLSEDDIRFARDKYLNAPAPAAFFDPPYRGGGGYVSKVEKDGDILLTLQNIARHGASLGDRAYYAVGVARTIGVPAGICRGLRREGDEGPRPAWAAVLEANGRRVRWNLEAARQPEHLGWRGTAADPQTFGEITDSELVQLGELQAVTLEKRLASVAIWKLSDLLEDRKRPDVLIKAIDLSPGNLRAWKSLTEMGVKRQLSPLQTEAYVGAIEKHLVKPNGLFALDAYMTIVAARGTIQQAELLERPAKWFADRPELLAMVRLEQGQVQTALKKPDKAVDAFRDAIARNPRNGPLVLAALERADRLLREQNAIGPLVALYADAWPKLPRPKPAPYADQLPWVIIGRRYAQALEDAGKPNEARNVRSMSDSVHTSK